MPSNRLLEATARDADHAGVLAFKRSAIRQWAVSATPSF
jgi:hypothetical protein